MSDDLEDRMDVWLADAPPEFVAWLQGVSVSKFLAENARMNFQLPGAMDGAMSEGCKAIFRQDERLCAV